MRYLVCYNQNKEGGYVTLLSVLVVGAVGTAITVSLLLLGLGASRSSFANVQSDLAESFADACAEEALEQIRANTSFTGSASLSFTEGDCDYTVTNLGGESRSIESEATVDSITRRVDVVISAISPQIIVTSWQEVDDF